MLIQVTSEKDAAKCPHNPFDLTKVWRRKDYTLIEAGVMELYRNPENSFAGVPSVGVHRQPPDPPRSAPDRRTCPLRPPAAAQQYASRRL